MNVALAGSRKRTWLIAACALLLTACGGRARITFEVEIGNPVTPAPSDPPYNSSVVYPSGLRLNLVTAQSLTSSYPAPGQNPFGSSRARHYERVGHFMDLSHTPQTAQVATDFRLSEYVAPVVQRGDRYAYVDPQIVLHAQQIRSGLGRPININSGYRSPEHNHDVGGATYSRHLYGDAADIDVDQTRSDAASRAQEIFNEARDVDVDFIMPLAETSVAVGGVSRVSWVHIDDRGF